jgi:soluble lytic murein transglycosylase-like protein
MISNCYDHYFLTSAEEFFGSRLNWLWLKAQALAESGLDPEAVSPVGAISVMQVMPGTAAEMARKHGIEGDPEAPHVNIRLGTAYDRRCFNVWAAEEDRERIRFMFGSYNAGPGNILTAQSIAGKRGLPTDS